MSEIAATVKPKPSERDGYWDAVKGGLMVLVVLGHFIQVELEAIGGGHIPCLGRCFV